MNATSSATHTINPLGTDGFEFVEYTAPDAKGIAALKSLYTPELRRRLVTYLRRIEFDIDREENLTSFWSLIDEAGIFPEYLAGFLRETVLHSQIVYGAITASADRQGRREFADELLSAARLTYTDEKTQQVLQEIMEARGNDGCQ